MARNRNEPADMEMFINYPFMQRIPASQGYHYKGFVEVMGNDYEITIFTRNFRKMHVTVSPDIEIFDMRATREEKSSPVRFLNRLCSHIKKKILVKIAINRSEIYRKVLKEYTEVLKFHINIHQLILAKDLRELDLYMIDRTRRTHNILIGVKYDAPDDKIFYIKYYDLPKFSENPQILNYPCEDSLMALYERFAADVENDEMQAFLQFMEEFDKNVWVVDPVEPMRRQTYRRINLTDKVSAIITYNSLNYKSLPHIRLLGPKLEVQRFEERVNEHHSDWDNNCDDPLNELLILLGLVEFIKKPGQENNEELLVDVGECNICFQRLKNNLLPEITCKNASCNTLYHVPCLFEWLCTLDSRRVYYEISGECPTCKKMISCPIPKEKARRKS